MKNICEHCGSFITKSGVIRANINKVHEMINNGEHPTDICRKLGIGDDINSDSKYLELAVYRLLRENGLKIKRSARGAKRKNNYEQILHLRSQGKSANDIAIYLGCSITTIYRAIMVAKLNGENING